MFAFALKRYADETANTTCPQKVGSSRSQRTLSKLHEKHWIPKGRQTVRNVLRHCSTCKRSHGLLCECAVSPSLLNNGFAHRDLSNISEQIMLDLSRLMQEELSAIECGWLASMYDFICHRFWQPPHTSQHVILNPSMIPSIVLISKMCRTTERNEDITSKFQEYVVYIGRGPPTMNVPHITAEYALIFSTKDFPKTNLDRFGVPSDAKKPQLEWDLG